MTEKYIVICGQEISGQRILEIIKTISNVDDYTVVSFPEQHGGPNYLRSLVQSVIQANQPSVFITRFEFIVSEFANAVADHKIDRLDVVFHLYHDDKWTTHHMCQDCQVLWDDWPFGVLR